MPRIDEMPEYRANLGRITHDLSHKFGFTATVAHLMPVFHDFLNPGETVELGVSYNLRTQPLQSAAMVDINSHVEYFFVPINLIYEPFGVMYYNINDLYSSNFNDNVVGVQPQLPVLDFASMVDSLLGYTNVSLFEYPQARAYRLFDMLGYNVVNFKNPSTAVAPLIPGWNPDVFPYPILAYNCIYQYYYRLDTRQVFSQSTFNWDKFNSFSAPVDKTDWSELNCCIQYRPKDSDYFTDVKVSPIVDVLNLQRKNILPTVNQWLTREQNQLGNIIKSGSVGDSVGTFANSPDNVSYTPSNSIVTNFGFTSQSANPSGTNSYANGLDINTANIRAIFANEKLWSITGRARKHYDDQTLAHFGYDVPHDPKHEISCFGHDRGKIHIGEVISTADTSNAALGEIAGKGYGSLSSKPHKFTAPCHGVVMAIMSFVPDLTYTSTYLKANAVAYREDFYLPEYDHLGMQPLFGYELKPEQSSGRYNITGWQYRYEQYKRRYNRVSAVFSSSGSLSSWMLGIRATGGSNVANLSLPLPFLHNPGELNQIMLVNYAGSVTAPDEHLYDGDPFVVDSFISCKKVSTMSDYSLPRLDA